MTATDIRVAGLDISTARIGYAAPNGDLVSITARAGSTDPYRRLSQLRDAVTHTLRTYPPAPTVVAVEGYSLAMMTVTKINNAGDTHRTPTGVLAKVRLGEVGGVIRLALDDLGIPWVDIPPSSLKRHATGNGRADKARMIDRARELGAIIPGSNDDEADAFHLRRMARQAYGLDQMTLDHERDAIAALDW